jgi:hypothetical protein
LFVADQLRFAFSRQALELRYGGSSTWRIGLVARHVIMLFQRYRGGLVRRMLGRSDRPS